MFTPIYTPAIHCIASIQQQGYSANRWGPVDRSQRIVGLISRSWPGEIPALTPGAFSTCRNLTQQISLLWWGNYPDDLDDSQATVYFVLLIVVGDGFFKLTFKAVAG